MVFFCMQSSQFQAFILLNLAHHFIAPHAPYNMTAAITFFLSLEKELEA